MCLLSINRLALILELIAGFLLAPELIGQERIIKLHGLLIEVTSFTKALLNGIQDTVKDYRRLFSRPFFFISFTLWGFYAWKTFQYYSRDTKATIANLAVISIASLILGLFYIRVVSKKWGYSWFEAKIKRLNLNGRIKTEFLAKYIEEVLLSLPRSYEFIALYFLMTLATPLTLTSVLIVFIMFIIYSLAEYILNKLMEADFRYALLKLGGILFVIKIGLQWIAL